MQCNLPCLYKRLVQIPMQQGHGMQGKTPKANSASLVELGSQYTEHTTESPKISTLVSRSRVSRLKATMQGEAEILSGSCTEQGHCGRLGAQPQHPPVECPHCPVAVRLTAPAEQLVQKSPMPHG